MISKRNETQKPHAVAIEIALYWHIQRKTRTFLFYKIYSACLRLYMIIANIVYQRC